MHFTIDQYAWKSRLRTVEPAQKMLLTGAVLLVTLLMNSPRTSALAFVAMIGLCIGMVGTPPRVVAKMMTAEALFLSLSLIGIVLTFSWAANPNPNPWRITLGGVAVSTSPAALRLGGSLLLRALAGGAALAFLVFSTPLVDILEVLRRLKLPPLLIDLFQMIYRFIFVMVERLSMMQTAQASRLGDINARALMRSSALLASNLFLEVFRRSQRMQMALDSRCFDGDFRILPMEYARDWRWFALTAGMVAALVGVAWL